MADLNCDWENRLREAASSEQAFQLARQAVRLAIEGRSQTSATEELQGLLRRISRQEGSVDNQ